MVQQEERWVAGAGEENRWLETESEQGQGRGGVELRRLCSALDLDLQPEGGPRRDSPSQSGPEGQMDKRDSINTVVPYTEGSKLKLLVQAAEDDFVGLTKAKRVRVIERGGDKLGNLLGRNDPWAAERACSDKGCWVCTSRTWLREQRKAAKKEGLEMPPGILESRSGQCRREGSTYGLQCMDCVLAGRRTQYQGESSRSTRERTAEHARDLRQGTVASPLVMHTLEEHGGTRPHFIAVINSIDPKPLYRVVRESVAISNMPQGLENLNRCQEWGYPKVPVLTLQGELEKKPQRISSNNPEPEWTSRTLRSIEEGGVKRVTLWDNGEEREAKPQVAGKAGKEGTQAQPQGRKGCKDPETAEPPSKKQRRTQTKDEGDA